MTATFNVEVKAMEFLNLAVDADGIAVITLDNRQESVNLVSPEWIDAFIAAIEQVAADGNIRGAIITSAKSSFMAGADLKFMAACHGRMSLKDAFEFGRKPSIAMHRRMETCGKPFVAALNGMALGGGFELALACHYRVLADTPKALVGLPEVTVGLLPGSGGTQRLPRMIGMARALPLLLEGRAVAPAEALELGLVDEVVAPGLLMQAARDWLLTRADPVRPWDKKGFTMPGDNGLLDPSVAALTMRHAPLLAAKTFRNYPAPIAILASVFEGMQVSFDKGLLVESRYFATLLAGVEARNIIRTSFLNKGRAEKLERRPQNIPKSKVEKLGIIGAGMMGAGIAYAAAVSGIEVFLVDATMEQANAGKSRAATILEKLIARGQQTRAQADAILARITPDAGYAAFAACDLVIEAVFEDAAVKADVTRRAEAILPATSIFASNTSTLPISGLAAAAARPGNFIGLHFFSPVERMALVEVIVGRETTQETVARALDFVAQLRKTPIIVNDSRGFYTSRVFQTFIHEGMAMLREGVAPALIENAARMAGMPVGPLAVLDETTLDLPWKIIQQSQAELGAEYTLPAGHAVLQQMINTHHRSGRKTGGGFYDYPQGAKKHLWPGLAAAFPLAAKQPDVVELKKRFLYIQALETARCLDEGVLTHPADGDLGAILGWGFPAYTGGTLSLIDTVGLRPFIAECEHFAQNFGPRFQPTDDLRRRAEKDENFYQPEPANR
jgi:3-hydroxyacyl-CoA dehydrogenase/enoyl-CoA hydratase/3-hydroxybutyryl-CoA epimerase